MTGPSDRLRMPVRYFEEIYATADDPWDFETSWYEQRKRKLTVAVLPRRRYRRAFEPGCSNGALTELLAERCDEVVALDPVAATVRRAARRLAGRPHVDVREGAIPEAWPSGRFDLVVLSEVVYYLTETGLTELAARLGGSLQPGGHVVAVHWTGETDYPLSGTRVHGWLERCGQLRQIVRHEDDRFQLSVLEAP